MTREGEGEEERNNGGEIDEEGKEKERREDKVMSDRTLTTNDDEGEGLFQRRRLRALYFVCVCQIDEL